MDYETLKVIWWGLVLFLLVGFVVMDGFDLGIGILFPFFRIMDRNGENNFMHSVINFGQVNRKCFVIPVTASAGRIIPG